MSEQIRRVSKHNSWSGILLAVAAFLLTSCATAAQAGPLPVIDTGVDPDSWAQVPAGVYRLGVHAHETSLEETFYIMVTDVTNAQYASYLNAALVAGWVSVVDDPDAGLQVVGYYPGDPFQGHEHEMEITSGDWLHVPLADPALRLLYDGQRFSVLPGYENHPMVMVSWFGARAYCEYYNWRLPGEDEWEIAARGANGRAYPWGDEIARNQANYYSSHDIFERLAAGLGDTTPVGFYNGRTYDGFETQDSASPFGLYDMAGNVWQWTADIHEGTHYRYLRGGSRADYAYNLRVWTRNSAGPTYASPNVGFRCVSDAPVP